MVDKLLPLLDQDAESSAMTEVCIGHLLQLRIFLHLYPCMYIEQSLHLQLVWKNATYIAIYMFSYLAFVNICHYLYQNLNNMGSLLESTSNDV